MGFWMTYRFALIAAVMAAVAGLAGCKHIRNLGGSCHDTKPYMKAQTIAPLKIPAGLDTPDTANALHIPTLNTPAPPRKRNAPCLDEPPPFNAPKQAPPQA